jgi:hypothetical protein
MSALAELRKAGLTVRVVDGGLEIGPAEALTPEACELVQRLAADLRRELAQELPAEPVPPAEPRFRAWQMRKPDGSRAGVMLAPGGMTAAEALAAVDRWPGMTVEPLPASACTIPDDRKLP